VSHCRSWRWPRRRLPRTRSPIIPSPAAAGFLATAIADGTVDPMDLAGSVEHAARWLAQDRLQTIIDERAKAYPATKGDAIRGKAVFTAKCNACHNADAQGATLAPGVGLRGVERLCEDIVAPNRNVDHTFRMSVIAIATDAIDTRNETSSSLMPEGFGESLSTQEFNDLLEFLLSRSAAG
jgi:hypothetical protein